MIDLRNSQGPIWGSIRRMQSDLEVISQHIARAGDGHVVKAKKDRDAEWLRSLAKLGHLFPPAHQKRLRRIARRLETQS